MNEVKPARQRVTIDPRRHLGMAWRRRVTIFWNAWLTLLTLGMRKP